MGVEEMIMQGLRSIQAGATSLIAALCDEVGLEDIVNSVLRWDEKQWKVSPGMLCKALVVNVLAGRKPLYKVEEFYQEQDVEKVLGEGVRAEDINDDALGRM